jgi:pantothenate kinase
VTETTVTVDEKPGEPGFGSSDATYDDLVARARRLVESGHRRLLGVTGAPGAGKSTLCAALLAGLGQDAALVGMDGFHFANRELARLGRADRKGAPDTFDVDGYAALLGRLRTQTAGVVYAPVFDRELEESIGSAVAVQASTPLVITEGNYLLLDDGGWGAVREHLEEVWFLDVDPAVRERRLVQRRESYGHGSAEAQDWVTRVDERNASVINATRHRADLLVQVSTPPPDPDSATPPTTAKEH